MLANDTWSLFLQWFALPGDNWGVTARWPESKCR